MKKKLLALSLTVCSCLNIVNAQTTVVLNPFQDNTLYESATGDISNGVGEYLFSGTTLSNLKRRALLQFDFSAIPAGAVITDVSLSLTVNQSTAGTQPMSLFPVLNLWGEGASDAGSPGGNGTAAETVDATWTYNFYPLLNWTDAGGDFDPTAVATTNVGGNGDYVWTSAQMISAVQNYIDGNDVNLGWILIGNESATQTAKRFGSRENATVSSRPALTITYTSACTDPDVPTISLSSSTVCSGSNVTITATGNLNDATLWHLYSAGCGTTPVDSNATGVFNVSPTTATTYYIRGEGGCVTASTCSDATVSIAADDDASFSYSASAYCQSESNPLPIITGTSGGVFTGDIEGLIVDGATGEVNLTGVNPGATYTITYTTNGPDCHVSSTATVTVNTVYNIPLTVSICTGDTYTLGSQVLSSTGTYTDSYTSVSGCDSIITLDLTVNVPTTYTQDVTVCVGGSLTVGANNYTSTGTYTDVLTAGNINGCDSTVTTNLTVLTPITSSQTFVLCFGGSHIVGSSTYSTTGIYSDILTSFQGCDSTVTTDLTVLPEITTNQSLTICFGASATVGVNSYSATGIYSDVFTSFNGCDSTVITDLTVLPENTSTQNLSVCFGGSVTVGTSTYSATGTYSDVYTAANSCDSTIVTNLVVLPDNTHTQDLTACFGQSVTVGTSTYSSTGTYTDLFTAANTCDSTVITNLTVLPDNTITQNLTACFGTSIVVGTSIYSSDGTYTDVFTTANSCDSTVITNLTVLPDNTVNQTMTVCFGGSITIGTNVHSATGIYTDVLQGANTCDSTVITDLTVLPQNLTTQNETVCFGGSVTVGTSTYTATGTYTDTYTGANTCDSVVVTNVTVLPENTQTQNISVCTGGSYTIGTSTYSATGIYTDVFAAANTCDSTVITNLTVLPALTGAQTVTVCFGQTFTVGTNNYSATGTYTDILTSFNACDSTVTTDLTVLPAITGAQTLTLCFGGSLTVGSSVYTSTGTFTDVLTSFAGCDSTVTTDLTVLPDNSTTNNVTVCFGGSTTVGANTYNSTGTYTDVFTGANSCDSTIITDLIVLPNNTRTQSLSACFGGSVTVGTSTYNATGTFTDVYTAANTCDSTVITNVTIFPDNVVTQNITACVGQTITVGTSTYNTDGTYTDVFQGANTCDSTVITNLTVLSQITNTQNVALCFGGDIIVGIHDYNSAGTYIDTVASFGGCDSIITTILTVNPALSGSQTTSVCFGGSILVGTTTHSTTGTFTDVITSFAGCDSTVTTDLTIMPAITGSQTLTVCAGAGVIVGTSTYTATGIYSDVLASATGCDSTVTTDLTVLLPISGSQTVSVCDGGSLTVGTSTYTATGTYSDVLVSATGCDSTVTTDLTVLAPITGSQTLTICAGASVTVGTASHTTTGTYTDVVTSFGGCDSTVTTDLTVSPAITGSQTLTVCAGISVTVGTTVHTATGIYTDIVAASNGCDSTVTTDLTVTPAITGSQTLTICGGASITVGSTIHTATGIYTDIATTSSGCDSTVTTDLTVLPTITGSQTMTVCAGASITVGTSTYTTTGIFTDALPAFGGCDSIVTTDLTVLPAITGSQTMTVCAGASVTVGTSTYTSTGTFTDVLPAFGGCDSTVTTDLTVLNIITNSQTVSVCFGESLTVGSSIYTATGTFTDVLTSFTGCDSTVTTNLTVRPAITGSQTMTVCAGASITVGTTTHNTTGTFTDVLTSFTGCDSTVTTNLTVRPAITGSQTMTVCAGASVTVGSTVHTATGTFTDVLTSFTGCDSTVTTNLTVSPAITGSQTMTVCAGTSVTVGTTVHTSTGTFTDVLTSFTGCDSTVTTNLTVRPAITGSQTMTVCFGATVTVGSATHTATGTFTDVLTSFTGCDSTVTTNLTVRPAITGSQTMTVCFGATVTVGSATHTATGTFTDVLTSFTGCDSTVTTNLTVRPAITGSQTMTVCFGASVTVGSATHTSTGTFTDVLTSFTGCDSTVTTNLTVSPAITGSQTLTVCAGVSVTVGSATHNATGLFTDILTAFTGCDSTVTTDLTVSPAITGSQTLAICSGASVTVGTSTYTATGIYADTLSAQGGCDSIVTTNLTVNQPVASSQTVTICAGTSITIGTNVYSTSGVYTDLLSTVSGCDSSLTTNLTVSPAISHTQTFTLCGGGSVFVGANQYSVTGVYYDTLTAHGGCDSTLITNLTIVPLPVVTMSSFGSAICAETAPFTLTNGSPAGGVYSGIGITASPTFSASLSGIGSFVITYTITNSTTGCSNSDTASISVYRCAAIEEYDFASNLNVYPNPTSGMFNISISNANFKQLFISIVDIQGREVYNETDRNNVSDYKKEINLEQIAKGIYYIRLSDGTNEKVQKLVIQ